MIRTAVVVGVLLIVSGVVTAGLLAGARTPPIVGRWQAEAPSSLTYDFSGDGAVLLIDGELSRQVFRYELSGDDTIKIYDGMGRLRRFTVTVTDDTMTLVGTEPGARIDVYKRVPGDE